MAPMHRIEKRRVDVRMRGRKSTWTTTWKKRLAVLRMCGLQLNELLEILSILSSGETPTVERTAQDNLQKLIGKGWPRMCAVDKRTIRKRLHLLNDLGQRDQNSRNRRRLLRARRNRELATISGPCSSFCPCESTTSWRTRDRDLATGIKEESNGGQCESMPKESSNLRRSAQGCTVSWAESVFEAVGTMPPITEEYPPNPLNIDNQSIVSTPSKKISRTLQRASFTSSQRLLVTDLLKMRYSYSSRATSTFSSTPTLPEGITESVELSPLSKPLSGYPPCVTLTPEDIMERHRNNIHSANFDITEACCYPDPDSNCIHKHIQNAILGISTKLYDLLSTLPALEGDKGDLNAFPENSQLPHTVESINSTDLNGNNALFFAARSAALVEVLLPILRRTLDINAVNTDGQTFLFLLDLEGFHNRPCVCINSMWGSLFHLHASSIECLISYLESRSFNFDQLDYNRRSFLSFHCASHFFNIEWFNTKMQRAPIWTDRYVKFSRVLDSSGMSYIHFVADNTKRAWMESLISQYSHLVPIGNRSINEYDAFGCPRLHSYLGIVCSLQDDESIVLSDIKDMVSKGASVNDRARDGSTALIIAARRCCPETVAYLLEKGAQVDHHDDAGFAAMDYAAEGFNRSRRSKVAANITTRSFKPAARLLDYIKPGRSKTRILEAKSSRGWGGNASDQVSLRSLASVTILEQYGAEGYPFRGVDVWKNSSIATLPYGLPDEMKQKITNSKADCTPRTKAKELKVKWLPTKGWRFPEEDLLTPITHKHKPKPQPGWI